MAKVKLELGAELDMLTKPELDASLHASGGWQREAALGMRHVNLPRLFGNVSAGAISFDGGQTEGQPYCGPGSGFYWKIIRVSVDGLASTDQVKLWKGSPGSRFITWIAYQPGVYHPGSLGLVLRPSEFLSISGTGLAATGQVTLTGEAVSVPGELMWKLL